MARSQNKDSGQQWARGPPKANPCGWQGQVRRRLREMTNDETKFDINTASDVELLTMTVRFLEDVRATSKMIAAVRRAAIRLLDEATIGPKKEKTFGKGTGNEF